MRMYISGYSHELTRLTYQDGRAAAAQRFPSVENLSYGVFDAEKPLLFLVSERGGTDSAAAAYDLSDEEPRLICSVPTTGGAPCYTSLSPDGQWLSAANYMGGSIDLYHVDGAGKLTLAQTIRHHGSGPDPKRQNAPHMHYARFFQPSILCSVDLGIDEVSIYKLSGDEWQLRQSVRLEPGCGPRHIALSKRIGLVYLICELKPYLYALDFNEPDNPILQKLNLRPEGCEEPIFPSGIRLSSDGKTLYAALRGIDQLASVHITPNGRLEQGQYRGCGGVKPREIELDPTGRTLAVANQDSDNVCIFALASDGGIGDKLCEIPAEKPTWIGFR